ncbi:unnamed protein product [Rhizophagus irregularis]|nr:unnamed protein product [Rhizophagus irregularis]
MDGNTTRLVQCSQLSIVEVFKTRKEYTDCYPRLYGFQTNQQPHFSRIYQFCLPTPIINITQPHDLWIDRWIPDSILKDQLPSASSNLAHRHTLQFYTDETHSNTQIGACIQDWPSTRAELMGIFLALLVSPPNSIIHIYTDSQSAIHSINNVLQHKNARRLDLDSSYDNRFTHGSNEFRFMPQYNRTSIEQNIRKFIHKALHFRNYGAWSRVLLINDSITIGTQLGLPSNKSSFLNVLPPNATAFGRLLSKPFIRNYL